MLCGVTSRDIRLARSIATRKTCHVTCIRCKWPKVRPSDICLCKQFARGSRANSNFHTRFPKAQGNRDEPAHKFQRTSEYTSTIVKVSSLPKPLTYRERLVCDYFSQDSGFKTNPNGIDGMCTALDRPDGPKLTTSSSFITFTTGTPHSCEESISNGYSEAIQSTLHLQVPAFTLFPQQGLPIRLGSMGIAELNHASFTATRMPTLSTTPASLSSFAALIPAPQPPIATTPPRPSLLPSLLLPPLPLPPPRAFVSSIIASIVDTAPAPSLLPRLAVLSCTAAPGAPAPTPLPPPAFP
jgi:hypothetical protein